MKQTIRGFITDPATLAVGLVGALGGIFQIKFFTAIFGALWSSLGTLFPAASILSFTMAPELAFLPTAPLKSLALALGALYVAKLGLKAYNKFEKEL